MRCTVRRWSCSALRSIKDHFRQSTWGRRGAATITVPQMILACSMQHSGAQDFPIFALDVRNGPATGPVATWLINLI